MNPYPSPNSVLVMDNCAIYHVEGVQEICNNWCITHLYCHYTHWLIFCSGVKLMYLLPYSPDFNPIEECFSFMKAYIC